MPLQIKELHIKMNVNDKDAAGPIAADTAPKRESAEVNNSDLVVECVEQVLEILREKMEP